MIHHSFGDLKVWPLIILSAIYVSSIHAAESAPSAPEVLKRTLSHHTTVIPQKSVSRLPDGTLLLLATQEDRCFSITSKDEGHSWSEPEFEFQAPSDKAGIPVVLIDQKGEIHAFLLVKRGAGRRPTVDLFYDIYHCRTSQQRQTWSKPKRIFEGYVGSLNGGVQLTNGRLVLPHQYWVPGRKSVPPTGSHLITASYSDDGGKTWQLSPSRLSAPCDKDYIGSNYGTCEPTILQLKDGRAWMVFRTQTGFLYESFSDDGAEWSPAKPTRFHSSNSPANLLRLTDGRIVIFWNQCEDAARVDGAPVYTTRDAIHAAISNDEGNTWQGFREVYRDPLRNKTPPKRGDRGTAYPFSVQMSDGNILLATGQSAERIGMVKIDPDWITTTHAEEDFSQGLENWSVFKPFGPAKGYWRDRTTGAELSKHPSQPDQKVLQINRSDDKPGDEAIWNFPAGSSGRLTLKIMPQTKSQNAILSLTDRFIQPNEPTLDKLALFNIPLSHLKTSQWQTLHLNWDTSKKNAELFINGHSSGTFSQINKQAQFANYFRIRSTADKMDHAGFLIASVSVDVDNNVDVTAKDSKAISTLPFQIDQPGSYHLATDLDYTSDQGAAIQINADEVKLNLNGKTIHNSAGSDTTAVGILATEQQRLIITNGKVSGFYFGIDLRGTGRDIKRSSDHLVANIHADRNYYFAMRIIATNSEINNCLVTNTGGSTRPRHTIPHGIRMIGEKNILRSSCLKDMFLELYPPNKGEIVGVHFDRAKDCLMENNRLIEEHNEQDNPAAETDPQERRFGVWVNAGPDKDTFLQVRNNIFSGFTVPLAFTPGSNGNVIGNTFCNCVDNPIRGVPAKQLPQNKLEADCPPGSCAP